MSELIDRAKEILHWHATGILGGEALRTRAKEIREEFGNVFDFGSALQQAEEETKRLALKTLIALAEREDQSPAKVEAAKTLRDDLLKKFDSIAVYWATIPELDKATGDRSNTLDRCRGVVFSILSTIDGCGDLPAFDLVAHVHPEDDDQTFEGVVISEQLHELYSAVRRSGKIERTRLIPELMNMIRIDRQGAIDDMLYVLRQQQAIKTAHAITVVPKSITDEERIVDYVKMYLREAISSLLVRDADIVKRGSRGDGDEYEARVDIVTLGAR